MKRCIFVLSLFTLLAAPLPVRAGAPMSLAGFELGGEYDKVKDRCYTSTATPLRDELFVTEVTLDPDKLQGFKGGSVGYGNCAKPGVILRIKLKFEDGTKNFFEELLKRYKKAFGEPDDWRGDPFHNRLAWKWSLKSDNGDRVSLILAHSRDEDDKPGNSVKLTLRSLWDEEFACFRKTEPMDRHRRWEIKKKYSEEEYSLFIPK